MTKTEELRKLVKERTGLYDAVLMPTATVLQMLDVMELLAEHAECWLPDGVAMQAFNKFQEGKS